jgi:amino acid transporter
MLVADKRPRNLSSLHAGPLLFGDWGTSRLYVLGLAFYYTGHASLFYLVVMSLIMAGVAWGYTVVCRCFPEGGGVYAASRRINPVLSVIAATLLLCDFVITAALSAVEGLHYLGMQAGPILVSACIGVTAVLGVLNWAGTKAAGRFAFVIAVAAIVASSVIGALCIPLLPEGLRTATPSVPGLEGVWPKWESLVRIVLALSGVEAVASMTGVMKPPVERTAKRTIWPVLAEVVILNLVFCIALNALPGRMETTIPDYVRLEQREGIPSDLRATPDTDDARREELREVKEYRSTAVKVLAQHASSRAMGETAGRAVAIASGIIFGLLLLSAVNTALLAIVSDLYALARDGELPRVFTRLNYFGVPWAALGAAVAIPSFVLLVVHDDKALGELYAIGVVGAITISFLCIAYDKGLPVSRIERAALWGLGGLMGAIELTIIVAKPNATLFASIVVGAVLIARYAARLARPSVEAALPTPQAGWLAEIREAQVRLEPGRPRIMLAARGRGNAEYAVDLARRRKAILFAIYVRTLRVLDIQPGQIPRIEDDPVAQEALGTVAVLARQAGVPFVPIYVAGPEIADEILDYTVTFGCDTLIMGKTRRGMFSRAIQGDVLSRVAALLPEGIELITRAAPSATTEPPRDTVAKGETPANASEEPPPT